MPTATSIHRGMGSVGNTTGTAPTGPTTSLPEARPTLSQREQLKIEFYKTYDVMTGVRIAATLGGFFSLMVLLVVYKSKCKSNRQLDDPQLTAAAEAAVAEAEAEERALAAALEAIARLSPKLERGPRRSLCVERFIEPRLPLVAPRFASVGGDYDSLFIAPKRRRSGKRSANRRCSSVTCSSTASSYLERRGSAMVMPCLPPPPSFPRHRAYDEPWDFYHPIDIQVIQPTPELSPCGSEAGLYGAAAAALRHHQQYKQQQQLPSSKREGRTKLGTTLASSKTIGQIRRAPLASMGSVDPPEPDSRSLGSDSVFLEEAARRAVAAAEAADCPPDTEDEVSGFSTDSSDGPVPSCGAAVDGARRFLKVPPKKKRPPERWDGCVGCVPRRRPTSQPPPAPCQTCMTISASVEAPRSPVLSTTTSSSQNSVGVGGLRSPPVCSSSSPIELKHRPSLTIATSALPTNIRTSSSPPIWSQETLF